jgi:hypothetical protein
VHGCVLDWQHWLIAAVRVSPHPEVRAYDKGLGILVVLVCAAMALAAVGGLNVGRFQNCFMQAGRAEALQQYVSFYRGTTFMRDQSTVRSRHCP